MKRMTILIFLFALPVLPQSATPPAAKTGDDLWQKTKDCAAQAEKLMAYFNSRSSDGGSSDWQNHYSPKYDKCFVSASYTLSEKDRGGKPGPFFLTMLYDAFERSTLAKSATGEKTEAWGCRILEKYVDCGEAEKFITEHMKN